MHIKNQVVLVTGGARGLGLAITHALINEDARVVVNYLNSHVAAQALVQQYPKQVFIYQADVTDSAQVKSMFDASFQHFGQHINAGLIMRSFNSSLMVRPAQKFMSSAGKLCNNNLRVQLKPL